MDWFIHIGTQKTGSKAIQQFLTHCRTSISGCRICFPDSGREGVWHQPIYDELLIGESRKLKMAIKECEERSADVGIVSCEAFYLLTSQQIKILSKNIGQAKVVLFIRRQDQLINSLCNQFIKAHRVNFEYIKNFEASITEYNPDFDYLSTIERWSQEFGFTNVIPIIYDKKSCSINDFLSHVGINHLHINSEKASNPNPALDFEALGILRLVKKLNNNDENLPSLVNAAHRVLRHNFVDTYSQGDQYLLSPAQRVTILDRYRDSNDALRKKYFPDQEKV